MSPAAKQTTGLARASGWQRVAAGGIAAALLAGLALAAWLTPNPAGYGTHTALGLSECGWLLATGHPCPTCGMTTSVALAADGNLLLAASAQPAGLLLALAASMGFWAALHVAATGSRLGVMFARLASPAAVTAAIAVAGAAWLYTWATWPDSPPSSPTGAAPAAQGPVDQQGAAGQQGAARPAWHFRPPEATTPGP